jgi:hypothetical protein
VSALVDGRFSREDLGIIVKNDLGSGSRQFHGAYSAETLRPCDLSRRLISPISLIGRIGPTSFDNGNSND